MPSNPARRAEVRPIALALSSAATTDHGRGARETTDGDQGTAGDARGQAGPGGGGEEFLRSALPLVEAEPGTYPWFAVRFDSTTFGIVDAFPGEAARDAHLDGTVDRALRERSDELFTSPPEIRAIEVLTEKL